MNCWVKVVIFPNMCLNKKKFPTGIKIKFENSGAKKTKKKNGKNKT